MSKCFWPSKTNQTILKTTVLHNPQTWTIKEKRCGISIHRGAASACLLLDLVCVFRIPLAAFVLLVVHQQIIFDLTEPWLLLLCWQCHLFLLSGCPILNPFAQACQHCWPVMLEFVSLCICNFDSLGLCRLNHIPRSHCPYTNSKSLTWTKTLTSDHIDECFDFDKKQMLGQHLDAGCIWAIKLATCEHKSWKMIKVWPLVWNIVVVFFVVVCSQTQ